MYSVISFYCVLSTFQTQNWDFLLGNTHRAKVFGETIILHTNTRMSPKCEHYRTVYWTEMHVPCFTALQLRDRWPVTSMNFKASVYEIKVKYNKTTNDQVRVLTSVLLNHEQNLKQSIWHSSSSINSTCTKAGVGPDVALCCFSSYASTCDVFCILRCLFAHQC